MSSGHRTKSNSPPTSAAFLKQKEEIFKQQEELFKSQSQNIGMLMDNLTAFDKLLRTVKIFIRYYAEAVRKTEEEIQNAQDQIAEIEEEQKHQFQALSKEDQRRMCEVVGLEYLQRAVSAEDEDLPVVDALSISDKRKELIQDGRTRFQEADKQASAPHGVGDVEYTPQVPDRRAKSSQNEGDPLQVRDERADKWRRAAEFVPMPHKRIEALRSATIPLPKAYIDRTQHQQELWSEDEAQRHTAVQSSLSSAACGTDIEELLRQNLERQRVLRQGLKRSKEDILQMQEDIKRGEERVGRRLPRVHVDVEGFLRAREVGPQSGNEEGEEEDETGG